MIAVIVGNPNCGKTTFFNRLTGSDLPVGNRPGVTVEGAKGRFNGMEIYDLPGIYSLFAPHGEEKAVSSALGARRPDFVLNVLDVNHLHRSLYLTEQLLSYCKNNGAELTVLLNMVEEGEKNGVCVDVKKLADALGCPVKILSKDEIFFDKFFERSDPISYKTHEQDRKVLFDIAEKIANTAIRKNAGIQQKTDIYHSSETRKKKAFCKKSSQKPGRSAKSISGVRPHIAASALFALIITAVIIAAGALSILMGKIVKVCAETLRGAVSPSGEGLASFLCDGVLSGIGSVLGFLPLIIALLVLTEMLEESGLLARAALAFDPILSPLGLSGRSAISLFLGCGCTAPAVFSARTASSETERLRCIGCVHLVPCSAKLPLLAMVVGAFVRNYFLFIPLIYLFSALSILAVNLFKPRHDQDFIMEVPRLLTPSIKRSARAVSRDLGAFIRRICTVVFIASIAVWVLSHLSFGLQYCDINNSMLAFIGEKIKYLFYPVGLYDWRLAVAIISGFAGKETTAGTLSVLSGGDIASLFDPITAVLFIVFILLSPPCAASLSAMRKELTGKQFLKTTFMQLLFAYIVCATINAGYAVCAFLQASS